MIPATTAAGAAATASAGPDSRQPIPEPPAAPPTAVEVYTMGPGGYFFSLFGHAAICVHDAQSPAGRCYNWGTADFSNPLRLAYQVTYGRAQFWVGVIDLPRMLSNYQAEDRSLYRQRLSLSAEATARLVASLHRVDQREQSLYTYHNLRDNCTTRIRDAIDEATFGVLGSDPSVHQRDQPSFRTYSHDGFAGSPHLIAGSLLLFGRAVDRPTSRYEGMFLPRVLREELSRQLHVTAEPVYVRRGPSPRGSHAAGAVFLLGCAALLSVACLLLARRRHARLARLLVAMPLGLIGSLLLLLRCVSPLAELRYNEVLFICWPCDLLIPWLPARWLRAYLKLRLGACGLATVSAAAGLLHQPLTGPLLLVVPLLLSLWAAMVRCSHERNSA